MSENNVAREVVYLASCAVRNEAPDKERASAADTDTILRFASGHMIAAAVAYALESAGVKNERTNQAIASSVRKTAVFDREWATIKKKFEDASISYMPLKGALLKNDYPKYGMREFADHDILIDPERAVDVREIMESLGYTAAHFGVGVHDVYQKKPFLDFEMHRALFPESQGVIFEYYKNVRGRLTGDGCEKSFSPEDFYLYLIAHEYKHFSNSGTGLRSLLDTFVCLRGPLDIGYIENEAEKMGIADFEKSNRQLALRLFGGEAPADSDEKTLDYILSSGTYGTISHYVENKVRKNGGSKLRYALGRFSVPVSKKNPRYGNFSATYPLFYRHKILLPALPFYRTFRSVKQKRFKGEFKALKNTKK